MPSVCDWIHTPLTLLDNLFEDFVGRPDFCPERYVERVKSFFSGQLSSQEQLNAVPSLNCAPLHTLPPSGLVRFRCLVQDMFDPEYFLGVYAVEDTKSGTQRLRSGCFMDVAQCKPHETVQYDSSQNKTMDRQALYCVPIPAENQWTRDAFAAQCKVSQNAPVSASHTKRSREEDKGETTAAGVGQSVTMETEEAGAKQPETVTEGGDGGAATKKAKTEEKGEVAGATGGEGGTALDLNFPLEGEKGPACLVKVYGSLDGLKLNEMVEFVGVLSTDPSMAEFPDSTEKSSFVDPVTMEMDCVEQDARCPSPSLVPRLHAVMATTLTHSNPLLPREISEASIEQSAALTAALSASHDTRSRLIAVLQTALYGDSLAAEYLLCHLLSRVYARRDVIALGQFCVNLSGCPRDSHFPSHLGELLSRLVAKSYVFPLTVENLNGKKFSPKKDYKANRLTTGQLQLSDHTQVLLDETAMQPGQLNTDGVRNLSALGTVINWQKVEYDFNFHTQDFPCNLSVLVCSEGKSLVKCDCQVALAATLPVQGLDEHFAEIYARLGDETLREMRTYLGLMQQLPYSLSEELQKEVECDFVAARKEDPEKMSVDDFHKLLVLARLVCISHGQTTMSKQMWEKTKLLERQRKQRLQGTAQSA